MQALRALLATLLLRGEICVMQTRRFDADTVMELVLEAMESSDWRGVLQWECRVDQLIATECDVRVEAFLDGFAKARKMINAETGTVYNQPCPLRLPHFLTTRWCATLSSTVRVPPHNQLYGLMWLKFRHAPPQSVGSPNPRTPPSYSSTFYAKPFPVNPPN